jgi:hypothetical protein
MNELIWACPTYFRVTLGNGLVKSVAGEGEDATYYTGCPRKNATNVFFISHCKFKR